MHHQILLTTLALKTPTPAAHKSLVHPAPPPETIWSVLFGSGLTSALLGLVTLVLLGLIVWLLWLLATGRLVIMQAASPTAPTNNRPPPARHGEKQLLTEHRWMPQPTYTPTQTPIPPRYTIPQQEKPVPPPAPRMSDDPLNNKRWVDLVRGCVHLFDELDSLFPASDPRQETANHVMYRLREILGHSGVDIIFRDRTYDANRHELEQPNEEVKAGTPIKIVSPGFAIGRFVLRPARVQVTNSPIENAEKNW